MTAYLWGLKESLPGNEDKILACTPVVRFADGTLALVETLDWEHDSGAGLKLLEKENRLGELVTILEVSNDVEINNDELPILIGPQFLDGLKRIDPNDILNVLSRVHLIQKGFGILLDRKVAYDRLKFEAVKEAKKVFDDEIAGADTLFVTERAVSALGLLVGNSATPREDYYTRILARARIDNDSDSFRRYVELASLRLKREKPVLEKWVDDYLTDRKHQHGGRTELNQVVTLRFPEFNWAKLPPPEDVSIDEQIDQMSKVVDLIWALNPHYLNGSFRKLWFDRNRAAQGYGKDIRVANAHLLKARTLKLSQCVWSHSEYEIFDRIQEFREIEQIASEVNQYSKRLDIPCLDYGVSQFPEARMLGKLCEMAFWRLDKPINFRFEVVDYGTRMTPRKEDADVVLLNEWALDNEALKKDSRSIFAHKGYYVFISKRRLMGYTEHNASPEVVAVCEKVLGNPSSGTESTREELACRCWLALDSGLKAYAFREYSKLISAIERTSKAFGAIKSVHKKSAQTDFDSDFEAFIGGETDIFIGGSVHARLLLNWWNFESTEFPVLLTPEHFDQIFKDSISWPPTNRLVLSEKIRSINTRKSHELIDAINRLFLRLSMLLAEIAKESQREDNSIYRQLITFLMRILVENFELKTGDKNRWRWSFVADERSMHQLILIDNNFELPQLDNHNLARK
jgi:hypothetical protein